MSSSRNDSSGTRVHVVAVDNSRDAEASFAWVARNTPRQDKLVVVNGLQQWPPAYLGTEPLDHKTKQRTYGSAAMHQQAIFDKYREKCKTWGRTCEFRSLSYSTNGELAKGICDIADQIDAESVVCGSRGTGVVGRMLLGSVSTGLLHQCHCNVIVAKDKEKERTEVKK
ncbi:hypothetical protein QOT17_007371 [Balamuthia mandrillaris]